MNNIKTFGVIGGGEFGNVVAMHLAPAGSEVLGFDVNPNATFPESVRRVGLEAVTQADVVVLAVPFPSFEALVPEVVALTPKDTLIVDICSVKVRPTELFQEHGLLDRLSVLMAHPMFGPQSIETGVAGKSIVVTEQKGPTSKLLLEDWQSKGLNIMHMTADAHDQEMARVHALTFFIGRALLTMDIQPSLLVTGYFDKLMALVETERHHSQELFETIQRHNPYAAAMRAEFLQTLHMLDDSLSE
ncbi:MAG: prephenate dehydrogenase/arogenate dehydrogenase family protein [Candidatus Saccharibacteria bacterium]|nr:prephenate dehydrogenase/arogenate dehydrogenase family protein [Candidatus Saccharibacteria bacterium]